MDPPTISLDYPLRSCLFDTQPEVRPLFVVLIYNALKSASYISEAAASLLDRRLELHIVPPTYLVSLSSPVG